MGTSARNRSADGRKALLLSVSASALLGLAAPQAHAQAAAGRAEATTLGEVVVTASRREETVQELPFNISAYGGEQLARANVNTVADLARKVPNFTIQDLGQRTAAGSIPIIRGLNASAPTTAATRYFQSPVGFYLGNAPLTGSLPVFDVQRIEVLRGPQGTLYGAGALGGAVRIVPVDPNPSEFGGFATLSGARIAESDDTSYSVSGAVNVPLGETAALRLSARHQYDAGFIDYRDVLRRENGNYLSGAPVLADPMDVASSPGVYFDETDGNYAETTSGRVSFLWEPTDELSINLAYNHAYSEGVGSNVDNAGYPGGPSPLDPRRILRPTGEYERSIPSLEPWKRRTELGTIDASYDLGFATLSTTLAYGRTRGLVISDSTVALLGTPYGAYYTGVPANPRTVITVANVDEDRSYTEEIRLVSASGGPIDYVVGAFFQQQRRYIGLHIYCPGCDVQSAAANGGSTLPIAAGGTYVPLFPGNLSYIQDTVQEFKDSSIYGDLTWHVNERWDVTGGARFFKQSFEQHLTAASAFFFFEVDERASTDTDSQIFKINTSYELNEDHRFYATWSQGYRRGGSNAFALAGPVAEPRDLLQYSSDKTNNYEAGFKGTFGGLYYAASVFYIDWENPQIDTNTPVNLTPVVVNGSKASSKGAEIEISGPVGPPGLSVAFGLAYAKARLTEDFSLPIGNGIGGVIENGIRGSDGDRLPGAPDWSGTANVSYEMDWADVGTLTYALGVDFRGSTVNELPSPTLPGPPPKIPAYALWNANVVLERDDWQFELYGANLANTRVEFTRPYRNATSIARTGAWGNGYGVSRPREIGVRLTRRW